MFLSKESRQALRHFGFLNRYAWLIVAVVATGLLGSVLEGLGIAFIFPALQTGPISTEGSPRVWKMFLEFFTPYDLGQRLRLVAGWLIVVTALKAAVQYAAVYAAARLQVITVKRFRCACLEQMLRMGMGEFNAEKSGYFQTLLSEYAVHMGTLVNNLARALPLVLTLCLLVSVLLMMSWKIVLISLCLAGLASLLLNRIMGLAFWAGRNFTQQQIRLNNNISELIKGAKVIRLFAREPDATRGFEKDVDGYNDALLRRSVVTGGVKPLFELLAIVCVAVILFCGSIFMLKGNGSPAVLLTFIIIFYRVSQEVMQLNQIRVDVISCLPCAQEIDRFLSQGHASSLPDGKVPFERLERGIAFAGVSFTYPRRAEPVLSDVNLFIPRGAKVGIVGPSGAGKSTVTELLLRFYDPSQGTIKIDGHDLRDMTLNSWRRKVALVSQDIFLFHDTIRANIAFANPGADQSQVERAARLAHAHDFIQSLPQGYDTIIGDRGLLLSGGQRQRIAIARAVMTDPEILIFDEATSALDTQSEQLVQQTLDELSAGRTVVTIAHRLSTIRNSDTIIVLDQGRILEQGSHDELLKRMGLYFRLNQNQLVTVEK